MSEKKPWRHKLYDRIPLNLAAMDRIIWVLVVLIVVAVLVGAFVWK